jgi:hypothetical protein
LRNCALDGIVDLSSGVRLADLQLDGNRITGLIIGKNSNNASMTISTNDNLLTSIPDLRHVTSLMYPSLAANPIGNDGCQSQFLPPGIKVNFMRFQKKRIVDKLITELGVEQRKSHRRCESVDFPMFPTWLSHWGFPCFVDLQGMAGLRTFIWWSHIVAGNKLEVSRHAVAIHLELDWDFMGFINLQNQNASGAAIIPFSISPDQFSTERVSFAGSADRAGYTCRQPLMASHFAVTLPAEVRLKS